MNVSVASIYNDIFNAVQSKVNIALPVYGNARIKNAAPAEIAEETDAENFEDILVKYLNGDRADETVSGAIDAAIRAASGKYGVDESLIRAIIRAESGYDPDAVSKAGAAGLMQLMPGTASSLGVSDPFNVYQNIDGGTKYIKDMLEKFSGDERLALAAYNAGPGSVAKYGGVPPYAETAGYVPKVLEYKEQYMLEKYRQAAKTNNS